MRGLHISTTNTLTATLKDHCIDAIRQYIQCHVDLTPINLVWSKTKGGILPDFNQAHTCRSHREAHEWVLRRNIANYENGMGDEGVAIDAYRTLERFGWA
jgi:thiamine kinase-like enzyme